MYLVSKELKQKKNIIFRLYLIYNIKLWDTSLLPLFVCIVIQKKIPFLSLWSKTAIYLFSFTDKFVPGSAKLRDQFSFHFQQLALICKSQRTVECYHHLSNDAKQL